MSRSANTCSTWFRSIRLFLLIFFMANRCRVCLCFTRYTAPYAPFEISFRMSKSFSFGTALLFERPLKPLPCTIAVPVPWFVGTNAPPPTPGAATAVAIVDEELLFNTLLVLLAALFPAELEEPDPFGVEHVI
uniref:Putative secreted protein n=1 Tax=Anopheles darlingi TaxID=43151 RepID=A0A2M4DN08_ANODA